MQNQGTPTKFLSVNTVEDLKTKTKNIDRDLNHIIQTYYNDPQGNVQRLKRYKASVRQITNDIDTVFKIAINNEQNRFVQPPPPGGGGGLPPPPPGPTETYETKIFKSLVKYQYDQTYFNTNNLKIYKNKTNINALYIREFASHYWDILKTFVVGGLNEFTKINNTSKANKLDASDKKFLDSNNDPNSKIAKRKLWAIMAYFFLSKNTRKILSFSLYNLSDKRRFRQTVSLVEKGMITIDTNFGMPLKFYHGHLYGDDTENNANIVRDFSPFGFYYHILVPLLRLEENQIQTNLDYIIITVDDSYFQNSSSHLENNSTNNDFNNSTSSQNDISSDNSSIYESDESLSSKNSYSSDSDDWNISKFQQQ